MLILLLLFLVLLALHFLIRYYTAHWSRNLTVELRFARSSYDEGETGSLLETVVNRKLLPFWWGDLQFHIPPFIRMEGEGHTGNEDFKNTVSAFSYEMVSKTLPFTAQTRGYYRIRGAELLSQDLLFRFRMIEKYPVDTELYVYPSPARVAGFEPELRRLTGEIVTRRHYIEDQFLLRGIRDYHPFDSLRRVNWAATARTGQMKVNQYDFTSSQEVRLLLNFDPRTGFDRSALHEDLIRVAAWLARILLREGIPVGLFANAPDVVTGEEASLPCRGGSGQLDAVLRRLARIQADRPTRPFGALLESELHSPSGGAQCVILSVADSPALQAGMESLRRRRPGVQWVLLRDRDAAPFSPCGAIRPYIFEVN